MGKVHYEKKKKLLPEELRKISFYFKICKFINYY